MLQTVFKSVVLNQFIAVLNIPHFLVECTVIGQQTKRVVFECARKTLPACNNTSN